MTVSHATPAAAIILAAGQGTRMKSDLPKVLHPVAGKPMVGHVLSMADSLGLFPLTLVISPTQSPVQTYARNLLPEVNVAYQAEQLGTAHAVLSAREALKDFEGHIVVLYGDTPLIRAETVAVLLDAVSHDTKTAVAVLGFRPADAAEYGRLITDKRGELEAIVEFKDANEKQRTVGLCNSGVMVIRGNVAWDLLERVDCENAKGEYYLTDIIALARKSGFKARAIEGDAEEVLGVNSRVELAIAEESMQHRLRTQAMLGGATLIAPETIFLSADTQIGRDVVIEPHVVIGPEVAIADKAEIRSFSHIAGTVIGEGAIVGPFARLRPGTSLGEGARIGNFVEVKKSEIEAGAKINHLSYIGDATVGENANVGAGTITCNYDGYNKYRTEIGRGAFIGSNTALVAPVKVGAGAIVAAGSVITQDVEVDALAVARTRQATKEEWAKDFREKQKK